MPADRPDHGRWFIFWNDTAGRAMVRCECGLPFATLRAWVRHAAADAGRDEMPRTLWEVS
jgi:hypothetical protein